MIKMYTPIFREEPKFFVTTYHLNQGLRHHKENGAEQKN